MKYPNAHSGVRKLFVAALLELIAGILTLVSAILISTPEGKAENSPLALTSGVLVIAAGVLLIIAFVLQIIGLVRAKRDNENFANSLWAIFVAVLATLVRIGISFIQNGGEWVTITTRTLTGLASVCSMLAIFYIITGISVLAADLGETRYAARGRVLRVIVVILFLVSFALSMVSIFIKTNETVINIMGYISIVASGVELVADIWYFFYLARAPRKLSK